MMTQRRMVRRLITATVLTLLCNSMSSSVIAFAPALPTTRFGTTTTTKTTTTREFSPRTMHVRTTTSGPQPRGRDRGLAADRGGLPGLPEDLLDQLTSALGKLNLDGIVANADAIKSNIFDGEFGTRGEGWFAGQVFLILCILGGGVPVVGDALMLLCGPLLLVAGLLTALVGASDLGESLSPWATPSSRGGELKTTGAYGYVRHPIYAGLLGAMAGLSIVSGSSARLVLTAVLFILLDLKTNLEEGELKKKYPGEYDAYMEDVPGKFFPAELLEQLPSLGNLMQSSS